MSRDHGPAWYAPSVRIPLNPAAARALACLATLSACAPAVMPDDLPCAKISDCPGGQACVSGVCKALPCGGRCSDDELCVDEQCEPREGLDCTNDSSLCGEGFVCSTARRCQRRCDLDLECTDPRFPTCNADTAFCGECSFAEDCTSDPARRYCDPASARCVACVGAAGCYVNGIAAGRYCDTTTHQCADGCRGPEECPLPLRCLGGTANDVGRCIECVPDPGDPAGGDNDCQLANPRLHCHETKNLCVQCLQKSDCPAGDSCDLRTNECVQCLANPDCPDGDVCDPTTLLCVPGCVGGSGGPNCPAALPACDTRVTTDAPRGTCVECLTHDDCPATGKICDSATLRCIPGCLGDDRRCPAEKPHCLALGTHGTCAQCNPRDRPTTCAAGLVCHDSTDPLTAGICRCKGVGEPCGASSECGFGGFGANGAPDCTRGAGEICITQVRCATQDRNGSVPPVCSMRGSGGLPERGEQGSCPDRHVIERAADASGSFAYQCVPDVARYTCPL